MKKILITLFLMAGFSCLSLNAQKTLRKPAKKPQKTQATTPSKPVKPQKGHSQSSVSLQATGTINGHGYVDLGLSVKWATCDIGADSPSDYGSYFAWGETMTKSEYTQDNSVTYGKSFGDISGDSRYDAARANWGGSWRLPTKTECEELINKCRTKWTTYNNHKGLLVTGPNGNSIFLPAKGVFTGSSTKLVNDCGYCWSSTPIENDKKSVFPPICYAYEIHYTKYGYKPEPEFKMSWGNRDGGSSIRPVSE